MKFTSVNFNNQSEKVSFSTLTIPDECCTKTCLNPYFSLHHFFIFELYFDKVISMLQPVQVLMKDFERIVCLPQQNK